MRGLIVIVLSVLLCSCTQKHSDDSRLYRLSDRFGVCIRLPEGASYKFRDVRIDFDLGDLSVAGKQIGVYVGTQPNFEGEPEWDGKQQRDKGWTFVGKERAEGKDKMLWGYRRYTNRGPLFVLFEGADIGPVERELTAPQLLVDCLPSNW